MIIRMRHRAVVIPVTFILLGLCNAFLKSSVSNSPITTKCPPIVQIINSSYFRPIIRKPIPQSRLLWVPPTLSSTVEHAVAEDVDSNASITTKELVSLELFLSSLIRQEETIIFALIERALFRQNKIVYEVGGIKDLKFSTPPGSTPQEGDLSFLQFMLIGTEALHSVARRYESPQEHPFFPSRLPQNAHRVLPKLQYPKLLSDNERANELNFNSILMSKYLDIIVPSICRGGDDEQYGSTVVSDITLLQALSKRVHYGKLLAESKYRKNPVEFQQLVDANDVEGVLQLLTNSTEEEQAITRARIKASSYGREPLLSKMPKVIGQNPPSTTIIAAAAATAVVAAVDAVKSQGTNVGKVDPGVIADLFEELIIPMTKDVQVCYMFLRCGGEIPEGYGTDRMSKDVTSLSPKCIL